MINQKKAWRGNAGPCAFDPKSLIKQALDYKDKKGAGKIQAPAKPYQNNRSKDNK